jgi:tetratricopeptide (TPR) repeat protein
MVEKYKTPLSYMTRAKVFLASWDKKSALKDVQKIKSLIKNDKEAQLFYFWVLFANDMHQECIIGLNKMLADFWEDADVYEFLGKSYQNVGKYFESIVCYEKALELWSRSGEIPTNLLTAKHALKEQDEAIKSPEDVILSANPVVVQKRIQKKKKHQ